MDFLGRATTFVRIVEAGSFSAAARSLRVSLAAVSRQLGSLEAEVGAKLLVRTTRSLQLTEEGRRFHVHAARLVQEAEAARASVRSDGTVSGEVVVSASVALGVLRIVPTIKRLTDAHPRLSLELRLEDHAADLVSEGIDVAVRAGLSLPDTPHLIAQKLATHRRVVVASPAYVRKHGAPKTIAALAQHAAIVGSKSDGTWRFPSETVTVRPILRVATLVGVKAALLTGLGIAILPDFVVHAELADGTLREVLPASNLTPAVVHALYRAEHRGVSRINVLLDHLRAVMPLRE